jgi:hypothetical protein
LKVEGEYCRRKSLPIASSDAGWNLLAARLQRNAGCGVQSSLGIINRRPNRTELTETEVTETENFGHKFGLQFEVTELTGLSLVITLG